MVSIDQCAPVRFLQAAFGPDDSIGVLLKTYRTGQVIQRIVPVASAISDRFQAWLRHMNAHGWNVYVGASPGTLSLQNTSPLPLNQTWIQSGSVSAGRPAGDGQGPNFLRPLPRVLKRG